MRGAHRLELVEGRCCGDGGERVGDFLLDRVRCESGDLHRVERLGRHCVWCLLVRALGATLEAVNITELREGTYYAELAFAGGVRVSARPSDAIALAIRAGVTIYGSEAVLADAGIVIADEQESEVEKFREFLDNISPEDFNTGS